MSYNPQPHKPPVRIAGRIMSCGHPAGGDQKEGHDLCPACYARQTAKEIMAFEKLHDINIQLRGSVAQKAYARRLRFRILKQLLDRVSTEGPKPFLLERIEEFRGQQDAQWYINRRKFSVKNLKRSAKDETEPASSFADVLADVEREMGGDQ